QNERIRPYSRKGTVSVTIVRTVCCACATLVFSSAGLGAAIPQDGKKSDYSPPISAASKEGEQAIAGFRVPDGMQAELVAAEPMLANPVAFWIDHRGRFYVAETFRQSRGVEDNRSHMNWLHDDLAAQ